MSKIIKLSMDIFNQSLQDYMRSIQFTAQLANQSIVINTKPGLSNWQQVRPSSQLLASVINVPSQQKIIHFGCHHGALSVILSKKANEIQITDHDSIALDLATNTLRLNRCENFHLMEEINLNQEQLNIFDLAVIDLPKGRKLAQRWIYQAYLALRPHGKLYLAGPNSGGIRSSGKDAESLFQNSLILGYKKGNRAIVFAKPSETNDLPEWCSEPGILPGSWVTFEVSYQDRCYTIHAIPGVFSYERLDKGTELFLQNMPQTKGKYILDLGCGSGLIGILAAQDAAWVDLVDSNIYATASTQKNLIHHQIHNARVVTTDVTDGLDEDRYDLILSNPPFHTGREIDYAVALAFIEQSIMKLKTGGELWIVANKFLRYNTIIQKYTGDVSLIAQTGAYHIVRAIKN